MVSQASFSIPLLSHSDEITGRYIVTFREGALQEGLNLMREEVNLQAIPRSSQYPESALDMIQLDASGGAIFPTIEVASVTLDTSAATHVKELSEEGSAILGIEPESIFYPIVDGLSLDYLRGYHDAVENLYKKAQNKSSKEPDHKDDFDDDDDGFDNEDDGFDDDMESTWGLKATQILKSKYSGSGIRIAVLDTGLELKHPDFMGRQVKAQSFVPGEEAQDLLGHGTHCIGTACGFQSKQGKRYGIAYASEIYAGKVISDMGTGMTSWILAGIEWAIANNCQIISLSLGNKKTEVSIAYETIGSRALQNGCLIVAAAGNHRLNADPIPGTVGQPANSPSIMAVAGIDRYSELAVFSCTSGKDPGANVDIAAPGVDIYSSVTLNQEAYNVMSGTSMAAPHVAGIAALYAEAYNLRGGELWKTLLSKAKKLPIPDMDVGVGLVQAC